MELMPFFAKVAEVSISLSVVVFFSIVSLRYLTAIIKRKEAQIETIINESNQRYDRLEERYTAQQNELLKINHEKDKFVSDTILKVTDSIATLTYTNAKAFKNYKNATENENIKT
jgi:predicted transcriptional regulator